MKPINELHQSIKEDWPEPVLQIYAAMIDRYGESVEEDLQLIMEKVYKEGYLDGIKTIQWISE